LSNYFYKSTIICNFTHGLECWTREWGVIGSNPRQVDLSTACSCEYRWWLLRWWLWW